MTDSFITQEPHILRLGRFPTITGGVTFLALNPVGAPYHPVLLILKERCYIMENNGTQSSAGTTAGTGTPSSLTDANELTGWLTGTFNAWVSVWPAW